MIVNLALEYTGTIDTPTGKVTFQRVRKGLGNIRGFGSWDRQMRAHVIPTDPRTPDQVTRRSIMALAVKAWQAAAPEVRQTYAAAAKKRGITTYMQFISNFMLNYVPPAISEWDGGTTTWDDGTSEWDASSAGDWDSGMSTWDDGATHWDQSTPSSWDSGISTWDDGATIWD